MMKFTIPIKKYPFKAILAFAIGSNLVSMQPLPSQTTVNTYYQPTTTENSFPTFNAASPTFSSFNTSLTGGQTSVPASGTLLQQIYPQPAATTPLTTTTTAGTTTYNATPTPAPFNIPQISLESVGPPEVITPGLATINKGKWVTADFFYNLPLNIGVKVEVIRPQNKYVPISGDLIERQIKDLFQQNNITPEPQEYDCEPPSPIYHVLIMAYPCENRMVGFLTIQLLELGRPKRIDEDLNGIWQVVTWQRQELIASNYDEFTQQITGSIKSITQRFIDTYNLYHPIDQEPCFNVGRPWLTPPR